MVLEQAMRFSKTTGYKLVHAASGCSCERTKRPTTDIKYTMHRLLWNSISEYNTNFVLCESMGMVVNVLRSMS